MGWTIEKYWDASNLDISELEKSYLGDEDKSNFSFKAGDDKELMIEELWTDI